MVKYPITKEKRYLIPGKEMRIMLTLHIASYQREERNQKDNKGKQDQSLDVVEAFLKENTVQLVDPLDIKKCSEVNAVRRDELLTELDTKIKVSNATVFVEIEE